jgi:phosphoglycolate phosphatase-like HAD superfamily hydrolase
MQPIEAILFEPVGCLAEFSPEPFQEIAARLLNGRKQPCKSGSRSYWHLLNLIEGCPTEWPAGLELQAVNTAEAYDDVQPALAELKQLGIRLLLTSSLSASALKCFARRIAVLEFFEATWGRDNSAGVKALPLRRALHSSSLKPERTVFLTDTAEGLEVAKSVGVNAVLMMNDPDEAKRLALRGPAGGIVSLHELPDFVRLVR